MVHKVNTKARIERHLRIYKENGVNRAQKKQLSSFNFNIVFFIVVILFPVYPTLASFVYGNSQYEFYRGDIEEEDILYGYDAGIDLSQGIVKNTPILESDDPFISINTILGTQRDLTGTNEIIDYEVQSGDSFSTIGAEFQVTIRSILEANKFKNSYVLQPGNVIKIPPVTGVIYAVKKGDTIQSIAKKYKIKAGAITEQNLLGKDEGLVIGTILVLPGAVEKRIIKPRPKQKHRKRSTTYIKKSYISEASEEYNEILKGHRPQGSRPEFLYKRPGVTVITSRSQYVSMTSNYPFKLKYRKPYSGAWGNCTYYVAAYKNINWRGNANRWIPNARAAGNKTGNTATIGAIVVLEGKGYNPRYGHVAIVMDIQGDSIIVSEMNYRKLNEVTYRKIKINDRRITGYIYVGE